VNGEVNEKREIAYDSEPDGSPTEMEIQCFDQSISLKMNKRPIGTGLFSGRNMMRGKIETDITGLAQIEVKELRRFFDGFGGCDGNNYASWDFPMDEWQIVNLPQMDIVDSFAHLDSTESRALSGEKYWSQYNFCGMLRMTGSGTIGVLLHYIDDLTFDMIRFTAMNSSLDGAGKIQFVQVRNGHEYIVSEKNYAFPDNEWQLVQFKHIGSSQLVLVDEKKLMHFDLDHYTGKIGLYCRSVDAAYFDNISVDFFN
jgi:hypothetical protein